ncbi:hypothetical protein BIFLH664_01359 [Bifidobacterium longum subsp. infantis]|uniref:Uncharacterized protein n=1 Tax=Bifidobacterium longum subsp. infantis TaxID=1682 RepID=A0ABD7VY43_BIFLI|nr:hypothetical protein BIFLH664_01359 [Bifidobacterium longum subsp. infantis]
MLRGTRVILRGFQCVVSTKREEHMTTANGQTPADPMLIMLMIAAAITLGVKTSPAPWPAATPTFSNAWAFSSPSPCP